MSETVFKQVNYDLQTLIKFIELGEIGLPDIQRPFVWQNAKVRDLFDSIYKGYPVGYFLFWQNSVEQDAKTIGVEAKQKPPRLLIVDGQQRLTSLYAVARGIPVVRENYESETIKIAFDPLQEKFEVADATTPRDKSYIPNISPIWSKNGDLFSVVDGYLDGLRSVRAVSKDEESKIKKALTKLHGLMAFPFTALELAPDISEEQVADVFVRINSKGKPLNQADFILTIMSVFWDAGRAEMEQFCRDARKPSTGKPSPWNHFIEPDPDQLLRVSVGVGFRRARLQYVYSILRGKDLDTGDFSADKREAQFSVLKQAQSRTLNLQYWHDFLKALLQAGYRSDRMLSSQNALLFAYILYLIGRTELFVEEHKLRRLIAQWFFMTALTGRFSSSPESKMEFDLARLRSIKDSETFVATLQGICNETLTNDFWTTNLPADLATAAARSPSMFAFFAAQNLLDARVLFSDHKVSELLDPATNSHRKALERHHLFPQAHLKSSGITDLRDQNQIANYALVDWADNAAISDTAPAEYVPVLSARFAPKDLERMYYWHALPDGWETMEYQAFLKKRRELMAQIIRDAYKKLVGDESSATPGQKSVGDYVATGETYSVEFKSTLRVNLHTGQPDSKIEHSVLKTIAAFLNSKGGALIIGIADNGDAVGIQAEQFPTEDKMYLHFVQIVKDRIGATHMMYMHPRFDEYEGTRVLVVECSPAKSPVFVKEGNVERLYMRTGASTTELSGAQAQAFIKQRFG